MFSKYILLLPVLLQAAVSAFANPERCTGDGCRTHDPCLIQRKSDGKWFIFSTGGHIGISIGDNLNGPFIPSGQALSADSLVPLGNKFDLWAPDVTYIDGTYYMYYAVSTFGSSDSAIGVATSKTLEAGSWTDFGTTGVNSTSGDRFNAIDPALLVVSPTEYYLSYGSFFSGIGQIKYSSIPLADAGKLGARRISQNTTAPHSEEGSYIYHATSTDYYYLLISSGVCCGYTATYPVRGLEYRIIMGRSKSPTGPFVDQRGINMTAGGGTTLLASHGTVFGPGGQGVYTGSNEAGDVLYYHYADTTKGIEHDAYFFGWNKLKYKDGWPVV